MDHSHKAIPRVVPWSRWDEFNWMHETLYSTSPELGLARIAVWRLRGNLPQAVEATVQLVSLSNCDGEAGRLALAMATIRCVNGVVDKRQKKKHAINIEYLAAEAKLPQWLVEIRHQATHNVLPSLEVLRVARLELLRYLETTYWQPQLKALKRDRTRMKRMLKETDFKKEHIFPTINFAEALVPVFLSQVPQDTHILNSFRLHWPGVDQALATALVDYMLHQRCTVPLDRCERWLKALFSQCSPLFLDRIWLRLSTDFQANHLFHQRTRLAAAIVATAITSTLYHEGSQGDEHHTAFANIEAAEKAIYAEAEIVENIQTPANDHHIWRPVLSTSEHSLLPIGTTILPSVASRGGASFF